MIPHFVPQRSQAAIFSTGFEGTDSQPDNVLVDRDGRARVLDFGLARFGEQQSGPSLPATLASIAQGDAPALTAAGKVAGTPGYMSPEQYLCEPLDARSDQFSFCAALYEGLYGSLPFGGKSVPELAANTVAGKPLPPPRGSQVPEDVRRILERGLKVNPGDRFPTLEALLLALHQETTDAWGAVAMPRRRLVNAALLVGTLATIVAQLVRAQRPLRIREMLITSAVFLAVFLVGGLMRRRTLLRNALHRRVWLLFVITLLQNLGLRLIGSHQGVSYPILVPYELLVMAGNMAMVSLYLGRVTLWLTGMLIACSASWVYFGAAAAPYISWGYSTALFGALWAWNRVSSPRAGARPGETGSRSSASGNIEPIKDSRPSG